MSKSHGRTVLSLVKSVRGLNFLWTAKCNNFFLCNYKVVLNCKIVSLGLLAWNNNGSDHLSANHAGV